MSSWNFETLSKSDIFFSVGITLLFVICGICTFFICRCCNYYRNRRSSYEIIYNQDTIQLTQPYQGAFDLEKCLTYVNKFLHAWFEQHVNGICSLDIDDFTTDLEARWRLIDDDLCGMVTEKELIQAVWNNFFGHEGNHPVTLPDAEQSKVDEILQGMQQYSEIPNSSVFTFWNYVAAALGDFDEDAIGNLKVMPPNKKWAIPRERGARTPMRSNYSSAISTRSTQTSYYSSDDSDSCCSGKNSPPTSQFSLEIIKKKRNAETRCSGS